MIAHVLLNLSNGVWKWDKMQAQLVEYFYISFRNEFNTFDNKGAQTLNILAQKRNAAMYELFWLYLLCFTFKMYVVIRNVIANVPENVIFANFFIHEVINLTFISCMTSESLNHCVHLLIDEISLGMSCCGMLFYSRISVCCEAGSGWGTTGRFLIFLSKASHKCSIRSRKHIGDVDIQIVSSYMSCVTGCIALLKRCLSIRVNERKHLCSQKYNPCT